jgi:hypothetical protein
VEIVRDSAETSVTTIAALAVEAAARQSPPIATPTWRFELNKLEWFAFMFLFVGILDEANICNLFAPST